MKTIYFKITVLVLGLYLFVAADNKWTQDFLRVKVYCLGKLNYNGKVFNTGIVKTGYMRHYADRLNQLYGGDLNDLFGRQQRGLPQPLSGKNYLYLNRLVPENDDASYSEFDQRSTDSTLIIADSLFSVTYEGETLFHYVIPKKIKLNSIYMIEIDSVLWQHECYQELWVDSATALIFQNSKVIFGKKINIDAPVAITSVFVSFDSSWTKNRFLSKFNCDLDHQSYDYSDDEHTCYWKKVENDPEILKAIKDKKVFIINEGGP